MVWHLDLGGRREGQNTKACCKQDSHLVERKRQTDRQYLVRYSPVESVLQSTPIFRDETDLGRIFELEDATKELGLLGARERGETDTDNREP